MSVYALGGKLPCCDIYSFVLLSFWHHIWFTLRAIGKILLGSVDQITRSLAKASPNSCKQVLPIRLTPTHAYTLQLYVNKIGWGTHHCVVLLSELWADGLKSKWTFRDITFQFNTLSLFSCKRDQQLRACSSYASESVFLSQSNSVYLQNAIICRIQSRPLLPMMSAKWARTLILWKSSLQIWSAGAWLLSKRQASVNYALQIVSQLKYQEVVMRPVL